MKSGKWIEGTDIKGRITFPPLFFQNHVWHKHGAQKKKSATSRMNLSTTDL